MQLDVSQQNRRRANVVIPIATAADTEPERLGL